jgi:hypothetical protein
MNRILNMALVCALTSMAHLSFAQSTNGVSDPAGRENWIPNRGFVGIGTRTPTEALEVIGNVKVSQTVFTNNLETVGLKATNLTVSQDASIGRNLLVSGNVGIGVANPVERLEISGNLKVSSAIFGDQITIRQLTATDGAINNSFRIGQKFIVDGLTGLGISAPVERLEVAGNAKVTQGLFSDKITTGDGLFSRNVQITQNLLVSGNTGFGVASPAEKVEITGNAKISQSLISDKVNSGDGLFSRSLQVTQNFNVTGNTGLGVASPTEKLEVGGSIKATGDVTAVNVRADKGFFKGLEADGSLTISGNVGIGVTSPVEKLEVAGNIKSTQGLIAQTAQIATDLSAGGNLSVSGNVGFGVAPGTHKLSVAGDTYISGMLTAENVTVKQNLSLQGAFSVTGPFGIGVATPEAPLHVNGDGKFDGNLTANKIIVNAIEIAGSGQSSGTGLNLGDNLIVNGSVAIGTTKVSGYKLSVNGKIRASDDIKVYLETEWSDFVFDKDYKLRTLPEVEQYIKENGHLPEIPTAAAVKKDGIDLGAMDAKLLQKIEEITIYLIEMKKENEALKKEVKALKSSTQR